MLVQHTSLALASLVISGSLHSRPALEHNMSVRGLPMLNCKARATAAAKIALQAMESLSVYDFACVVIASCVCHDIPLLLPHATLHTYSVFLVRYCPALLDEMNPDIAKWNRSANEHHAVPLRFQNI